jgi:hypothetical protein
MKQLRLSSLEKVDLQAFAKRAGHKVVAAFKETASGTNNGRPERVKVLAPARAHNRRYRTQPLGPEDVGGQGRKGQRPSDKRPWAVLLGHCPQRGSVSMVMGDC